MTGPGAQQTIITSPKQDSGFKPTGMNNPIKQQNVDDDEPKFSGPGGMSGFSGPGVSKPLMSSQSKPQIIGLNRPRVSNDQPQFSGPGAMSTAPKPVAQPAKAEPKKEEKGLWGANNDDISDEVGEVNKDSGSNYDDDFEASDPTPA